MSDAATQLLVDAVLQLADFDEVVLVANTERRVGPTLLVQRCACAREVQRSSSWAAPIGWRSPGGATR
jgi:hypothetical protein